jgi:phage tail protein X
MGREGSGSVGYPNTDGFDIEGTNITLYDTTVSVGDQEVAIGAAGVTTDHISIERFWGYNKGGITILGNGDGTKNPISNVLVKDAFITADLPSVVGTTVNGVTEQSLKNIYGLQSYGQALPAAMNDNKALQITFNMDNQEKPGEVISNVTYQSVCIQDIAKPFQFLPLDKFSSTDNLPTVQDLTFKDVHVLPPSAQFPLMGEGKQRGIPVSPPAPGGYQLAFQAYPPDFTMSPIFDNVVFDDVDGQSSLLGVTDTGNVGVTAIGNVITTQRNVYPPIFNLLSANEETTDPIDGISVDLASNSYAATTPNHSPGWAFPCKPRPSFMVGDLYASVGDFPGSGASTNLQFVNIKDGTPVTLNAVVQPAMSQTTLYLDGSYEANPGLVALASPALTNAIRFYDGRFFVGSARLSGNGTLASLTLRNPKPGIHIYTAEYPGDAYYDNLSFGFVVVRIR